MAIGGIGLKFYQNNVEIKRNTKNVNGTEKFALEKTGSTQELSEAEKLEAFKKEIWEEINSMPRSSSISWSINITDEAFERMMNEPEFKEKTMSLIREDAAVGRSPITACVVTVDVNGYSGYSYMDQNIGKEAFSAHSKDKNNFYTKKATNKSNSYDLTEYYEKERRERELQQELRDKEYFQHKSLTEYWNKRQSAATSYETNILMIGGEQGNASNAYDANVMTEAVAGGDTLLG
jgi:peroxiredoxin family protein